MNRVKDYLQFTVWFVGLGYLALWPLTAHDNGMAAFGAAFICGGHSLINMICDPAHALRLSPGLHLIGTMSAACVIVRLLLRQWCHWRWQRCAPTGAAADEGNPAERNPATGLRANRWSAKLGRPSAPPSLPLRAVRPRTHFGLRGAPH
jgi:hypothetical protein